jgi:hypothetical protein
MNGKGYGKLSIVTATQLLKSNEHVMNISVRGNHLTTEAGSLFTQGMSSINNDNDSSNSSSSSSSGMSNSFCKLDLSFNLINLKNLRYAGKFFRGLYKIDSLHTLILDSNEMTDDALWAVASFLASNPSIKTLSLRDQDFKRRATMENLFQNLRFNNKLSSLDLRYNPSLLSEYIFTYDSYDLISADLEENNPGLRVLPFHEDPTSITLEERRRIPHRKDLYPLVKNTFEYDDLHRQINERIKRNQIKLNEKGSYHIRYSKHETFVA